MELLYKIKYETSFLEDIEILNNTIGKDKIIKLMKIFKIKKSILKKFPRIYQRLELESLKNQEYRKIVINQYIIVYKITLNQISFLKIFPQKSNYIKMIEKW